jgi:hypothetical protein
MPEEINVPLRGDNHMRRLIILAASISLLLSLTASAQEMPRILSLKEQAEVMDKLLEVRLEKLVPDLMRREGIDMWVLIAREYNEDPVVATMLPAQWMAARRLTILIFFDRGPQEGIERLSVSRYDIGRFFRRAWDVEKQPDQWKALADVVFERKPQKIALNYSDNYGHADGVTLTLYRMFVNAVGRDYADRIVSGEKLAVGWLETRTEGELVLYPQIVRIAHTIIAEGLSDAAIVPGVTTTDDLQWWFRERIRSLGLETWFHTGVEVQRAVSPEAGSDNSRREGPDVIMPGDLIHMDIGITYLRLNTDTQQNAYVLRPGETDAPEGLKQALAVGNRLQDILTGEFVNGRTGNEILKSTLEKAKAEGIRPSIYSHPLGMHGHAAGTTIGLWDHQEGVVGAGDYPLHPSTCYAIELNATVFVPEWNKDVRMGLEESACFDGRKVWYLDGRQKELYLIGENPTVNEQ